MSDFDSLMSEKGPISGDNAKPLRFFARPAKDVEETIYTHPESLAAWKRRCAELERELAAYRHKEETAKRASRVAYMAAENCGTCNYGSLPDNVLPCRACMYDATTGSYTLWQRMYQKEEGK